MTEKYKISIILCTWQNEFAVYPSYDEIMKQDFPKEDYEIVLVGDGVDLSDFARMFNIKKYIYVDNPDYIYHPNYVRNKGIMACEGQLVFFLHDNVTELRGKDYLSKLWKYSENGTKVVFTVKEVKTYTKQNDKIFVEKSVVSDPISFYAHQDAAPLSALIQVRGFDELFDGDMGYDDKDLESRLKQIGIDFIEARDLYSIKHNYRQVRPPQKLPNRAPPPGDVGHRNAGILCGRLDSGFYARKIP